MSDITKKTLEHLAELARLHLTAEEAKKLTKDLKEILSHVQELQSVDTKNVAPLTGGTSLRNVFRDDVVDIGRRVEDVSHEGRVIDAFPESEKGYLKVPKIL